MKLLKKIADEILRLYTNNEVSDNKKPFVYKHPRNYISLSKRRRHEAYKWALENLRDNQWKETLWLVLEDWLNTKNMETTNYTHLYEIFPELWLQKPDKLFDAANWVWWKDDDEKEAALRECIRLTS